MPGAVAWPRGVSPRARLVVVRIVEVLAELANVTVHVVPATGVRDPAFYGLHLALRIDAVPSVLPQHLRVVPERVVRSRSGAAAVLPLGLRGQAVLFPLLLAQPLAKIDGVVPGHRDDGMVFGLLRLVLPLIVA